MQSALQNSYNLLKYENRLTIGYFGGSITSGDSAKYIIENGKKVPEKEGSIADSYVNRTSAWIKRLFPNAVIETVNAGISDTHTQLGLYRLESTLMNENGHNMPDLVFIEFTSNDWVYGEHTVEIITAELESLIINIRKLNPFADIVIIATNTLEMQNCPKKFAHKEIADHYGIPFIDVGEALQNIKDTDSESSHAESEKDSTLKYTADNLHSSALGFAVYLEEIKKVLTPHLDSKNCKRGIIDHTKSAPTPLSKELYIPRIISADDITAPTETEIAKRTLCFQLHGTLLDEIYHYEIVKNCIVLRQNESITAEFKGGVLGMLVAVQSKTDVNILYRVDSGEWQEFAINDSRLGFQRYPHTQAFFLKAGLSAGKHIVTLKSVAEAPLIFGAFLAQ